MARGRVIRKGCIAVSWRCRGQESDHSPIRGLPGLCQIVDVKPNPPMSSPQLIDTPASVPGSTQYQQLAYLDAYDAVNNDDYAFVAYKETDSSGAWRVRISGRQTSGGVFEPDAMKSQARSTSAQGKPWFQWGWSLDPSEGDPRCVQFRVHVKDGSPLEIEIFAQLRRFDHSADEPKSARFAWPV